MKTGEAHVWLIRLAVELAWPPPTADELARASQFRQEQKRREYLRSHAALRTILSRFTDLPLDFAATPSGKPYLPAVPQLQFNLSHSGDVALVGTSWEVAIGVDVEQIRPLSDYATMAQRFFPESEAAALVDERDFFRRWTQIEARVKALGVGLTGMGVEMAGEWTLAEIDAGPVYSAAVALPLAGIEIVQHDFGGFE